MSNSQPALDVFFYFQKQELKLSFNSPNQAAFYQNRNRESRIFANEPNAVYLPLAPSMVYLRDSSKGLVIGFAKAEDADLWCRTSILGQKHGHYEVHIGRGWTDEQLNQALQVQHQPYVPKSNSRPQSIQSNIEPTPPSSSGSDTNMKSSSSAQGLSLPRDESPSSSQSSRASYIPSSLAIGSSKNTQRSKSPGHTLPPALLQGTPMPRYSAQDIPF
ncbi:unnamed protein product [Aspergillus oryzae]|uniref:Uncharacterized protein n=1 Tax=Aspergillus oryzae (strain 3.042) TaxID=1160506 RepID=I8TR17_ASPO3|nr:hypothetical protein Ao3042_07139 [Aspergillus oryzae 3.042]KDE80338.1 hypothetical protein AO1008_06658 [Aspergillus oryzae 100-8]GMF71091.1 unnamed protein product [Aspergillus oryzae]GMF85730.1 unnamed protein product [Aspergillus oryzae]|eukprot:EIT76720.1 hypothetical protein Ao3042_07139 [Aspergillus oryzae 3.042]